MAYTVRNTDKYDDEVFEIVLHITTASGDKKTALDYLDEIKERTMILADFPESGSLPRNATLRKQGYRVFVVAKHHAVFYKVDHEKKEVMLYHLVDTRRDYIKLIK